MWPEIYIEYLLDALPIVIALMGGLAISQIIKSA
jgi:hypothetical protein